MEGRNSQIKKWSKDPTSEKYHSRSAEYKAKHKNEKSNKGNLNTHISHN